jgi:hypothetical protein
MVIRILMLSALAIISIGSACRAQSMPADPPGDVPVYSVSPSGIASQTLPPPPAEPPPSVAPISPPPESRAPVVPNAATDLQVAPHEGPQEKALDRDLGLEPAQSPPTDAEIEARINAAARAARAARAQGAKTPKPVPSSIPETAGRWEGPQERALDRVDPGSIDNPPPVMPGGAPDAEDPVVKRLNGGN